MEVRSKLVPVREPKDPRGAVLVLHGGASRGDGVAVSPTQLSVLRMVPIARRVARVGRRRLAVFRLLNSARGWDTHHTPVDDVHWALGELRDRLGDVPVCLVGHSLGGRAALLAGDQPAVRSVVALNPWVYDTDGDQVDLSGRRVLVVHGDADRIASPRRSALVAQSLRRTTEVGFVSVQGGKHAMLRRGRLFDRLAADFARATLLGDSVGEPLRSVLAGEALVET